jgi:hypothetical protein
VAAAARLARAGRKAHSRRIITDDDLQSTLGPLPSLKMNEAENGEEVVAAITRYKQTHSPEETEVAVRRWYDEYDKQLADAIQSIQEIKALRGANLNNAADLCEKDTNYQQCNARRSAEARGARYDQQEITRNGQSILRLQHSLLNIRNHLLQQGFRYEWFKVRTTNNVDRF